MPRPFVPFSALLLLALAALILHPAAPVLAQPASAVAKRDYNRALRAEKAGDMDAAKGYWQAADEGWSGWLDGRDLASGLLTDRLVMAGISFYKNGHPEAALPLLDQARKQDPYRFEPYVFGGLARAALGQKDAALEAWNAAPSIAVDKKLAPALVWARQDLAAGRVSLADAARTIEDKCRELTDEIMVTDKKVDPWAGKKDSFKWGGGAWGQ